MKLYVIRHAEAVPSGTDGVRSDEERYLTPAGHAICLPLAKALRRVGAVMDVLFTSPLVRARQTAAGVLSHWGEQAPRLEETALLAPGAKKRALVDFLRAQKGESFGLVGHNPDLSELVGWLIGDKGVGLDMEKAGVALVEFDRGLGKGSGTLAWLVTTAWLG
jgi:phosphohistidine phosphatase